MSSSFYNFVCVFLTEAVKIFHAVDFSDSHAKLAYFFLNKGNT